MSISHAITPLETEGAAGDRFGGDAQTVELLRQTFGVDFSVLDGTTGELLYSAFDQSVRDWGVRAELCRQVAERGRPEFIDDEDPFLVLALPLGGSGGTSHVAVATFVTRTVATGEDVSGPAWLVGLEPEEAGDWATRQIPWSPEALQRVAELVLGQSAEWERIGQLEEEVRSLSAHMVTTYEEISLLYRLTQNLRISEGDADLGRVALEWLGEVLPAKGLAIQLVPVAAEGQLPTQHARTEPTLLISGQCPVDNRQFDQLIEHLSLGGAVRPSVVNRALTERKSWPCPTVRQMITVPLAEGEHLFGYLAAFNHRRDAEFGTVEANLLNSVGAILGIHRGNIELYRQQSDLLAGIIRALTSAIDAKDPYTRGHSDRVARVAVRLGRELGCDAKTLNTIYLSGLLHDIGKIGIDDNVLRKPDKLTDGEYEHIKRHAEIGYKILRDMKKLDDVLPVVLHHHESWDGRGYPHRLPGEEIPLAARIVAVADSFDAMGSDRPYRKGMLDEEIDNIFRAGAGKQWDPDLIDAFFLVRDDLRKIARQEQHDIEINLRELT